MKCVSDLYQKLLVMCPDREAKESEDPLVFQVLKALVELRETRSVCLWLSLQYVHDQIFYIS